MLGLSDIVEILRPGLHGMDDEFIAVVEDQDNELNESAGGIGPDHEPPTRIISIVEGATGQDMNRGVQHRGVVEAIAGIVLAGRLMQFRQHASTRGSRHGSHPTGW